MMPGHTQDLGREQALQVWRDAQVQRELAQAQAAWQLRLRRLTRQRWIGVAVLLIFWTLGLGCGVLITTQAAWRPHLANAPASAADPALTMTVSREASSPHAPPPEGDAAETHASQDPTPAQVSQTQAASEPPPAVTTSPAEKETERASAARPRPPSGARAERAAARPQAQEAAPSAETGRRSPTSHPPVSTATAPDTPGPSASSLLVLSVPMDGVAMVQTEPNKFKSFRVGDTLPDGSVMRKADALTGKIETQRP